MAASTGESPEPVAKTKANENASRPRGLHVVIDFNVCPPTPVYEAVMAP